MLLSFSLCLPRDGSSVPFVRHLCRATLERLGVEQGCIDDIEIAVSEACTNVYKHAHRTEEEYEVMVTIDDDVCTIEVTDAGPPFDQPGATDGFPVGSESGRGIKLMRALVDDLQFETRSEGGTVVTIHKTLALHPASMLRRLGRAGERPAAPRARRAP